MFVPTKQRRRLDRRSGRTRRTAQGQQPGTVDNQLRRRMGDALADLFDEFGPEIYSDIVLGLKEQILARFQSGFEEVEQTIKDELGRRGVEESRQHIRGWANKIVEDVNHYGLDEVATALEDYVSSVSAAYISDDSGEGDELLEIEDDEMEDVEDVLEEDVEDVLEEDVEDVLEEDVEETEQPEEMEDFGLDLEEGAEAGLGGRFRRRRRPVHRRI